MSRRPGFIVIILFFIVCLLGFYLYLKRQQSPLTQPIHAVPTDASLLIEIKKPADFLESLHADSDILGNIKQIPNYQKFFNNIAVLDSVLNISYVQNIFDEKSVLISLHDAGNGDISALFVTKLSGKFEANQWFKFLEESIIGENNISSSRYNQVRIIKANVADDIYFYAFHRGVMLVSKSEMLLKNGIRQVENENGLQNNEALSDLLKTAGDNVLGNIYLRSPEVTTLLHKIVSKSYLNDLNIKRLGTWTLLDLNLKKSVVLMNGFTKGIEANDFQYLLKGQQPVTFKFTKYSPVGIQSIIAMGISDYNLYKKQLQELMQACDQDERYNINQKSFRDAFGDNAENRLAEIFNNELVQLKLVNNQSLFYIRTNGYRDAKELLDQWLSYYAKVTGTKTENFKRTYKLDAESKFPIYEFPLEYIPARLFGPWFKGGSAKYATCFDDYIIFSSDYKSLTRVIFNNILQKTLSFNGPYNQYADFLATKVNFHAFVSLQLDNGVLSEILQADAYSNYYRNKERYSNLYGLSWQFSNENEWVYNNVLVKHQPVKNMAAATEWEARLDTLIAFKPQLVKNHNSGSREIFVQDLKNNIYLVSSKGRILWKKAIKESILGEVHQVDYYKNGKLQYLFNTNNKLYLIDRNGNYVERYPMNLDYETELPLALFDYDKRKNYRIFIAAKNKKVSVYGINGKSISGFKFDKTDNRIISEIQHVRNNSKDYIIVSDSSRIYVLNRRGETRVNLKKQFTPSPNNQFIYQKGNASRKGRLIRSDIYGKIYFIYFDGSVEEKTITECSKDHYFELADVTGDNVYDFIFIDTNKLTVYDLSGKKQFSYKFDNEILRSPSIYKFSAKSKYMGITDVQAQRIYLIDGSGQVVDGFPLPGKTKFSIGLIEKTATNFNLIVGGDDQYLYNYKLN